MAHLLIFLLAALGCLPIQAAPASAHLSPQVLPAPVLQALKSAGIPPQSVGIVVQALDAAQPVLRHQAAAPMNPASLMKLLTTLAALEILGPAYTWRTDALAPGPLENGVLAGDLYLRGSGDPKFTYDRLWLLLRELRARGLREIRGDLILDGSAFTPTEHDPSAFDGKPLRPYNVGPDALLFNFATVHLTLWPDEKNGGAIQVRGAPLPAGFEIINRLQASDAAQCGDWRERLEAKLTPGQVILSGAFPRVCGEQRWNLAGLTNAHLLHGVFTQLWRELGGQFAGQVKTGVVPTSASQLASSESPTLGELVRDINKYSNNVMARQVFLKVGAGETAAAERAMQHWLAQKSLDFPELVMDNGAGLSRRGRISADHLAQLLSAGWHSPFMPEYLASLPIAAIDGTLKKKLNGHGVAGQAHLKTGSLEGVRGIAGYLTDRNGRRYLLVCMVNHPKASAAQPAFDALLEWAWQDNTR